MALARAASPEMQARLAVSRERRTFATFTALR